MERKYEFEHCDILHGFYAKITRKVAQKAVCFESEPVRMEFIGQVHF